MARRDEYIDNLDRIFTGIGRQLRHVAAEDPLTIGQYSLLKLLSDFHALTVGEIAEHLGVSLAAGSGMIDRLVHTGLIIRTRSEVDRRVVTVSLTDEGCQKIERLYTQRKEFLRRLFMNMSEEDLKTLLSLIASLENHVVTQEGEVPL